MGNDGKEAQFPPLEKVGNLSRCFQYSAAPSPLRSKKRDSFIPLSCYQPQKEKSCNGGGHKLTDSMIEKSEGRTGLGGPH
jgi:hypothetical protein